MKPLKKVVIIGASFAGLKALSMLSEYDYRFEVMVIDKKNYSTLTPKILDFIFKDTSKEDILINTPPILRELNSAWENDEVVKIDKDKNVVFLSSGKEINYDYLIIASGAQAQMPDIKGAEYAYCFNNFKSAEKLKEIIKKEDFKNVAIATMPTNYLNNQNEPSLFTFCEEEAVEFAFYIKHYKKDCNVTLISPNGTIIPSISAVSAKEIEKDLKNSGIEILALSEIESIEEDNLIFLKNDMILNSDLTVIVAPLKPAEFIKKSNLGDIFNWVHTNEYMQVNSNIFAIGDINYNSFKTIYNAFNQAQVAVHKILESENIKTNVQKYNQDYLRILQTPNDAYFIYDSINKDIIKKSVIYKEIQVVFDKLLYKFPKLSLELEEKLERSIKRFFI